MHRATTLQPAQPSTHAHRAEDGRAADAYPGADALTELVAVRSSDLAVGGSDIDLQMLTTEHAHDGRGRGGPGGGPSGQGATGGEGGLAADGGPGQSVGAHDEAQRVWRETAAAHKARMLAAMKVCGYGGWVGGGSGGGVTIIIDNHDHHHYHKQP